MIQIVSVALLSAAAAAQTPDPRAMLQEAAAALGTLQSAAYDGRLEMTGSAAQRVITGRVTVARDSGGEASFLGGKVVVRGEVSRGSGEAEKFELAFDGRSVRRFQSRTGSLLQADPGHGGEGLMQGPYGGLILRELVTASPLAAELGAAEVSYAGCSELEGRPADIVEVKLADGVTVSRWYIDAADRLPRRCDRSVRSASGAEVQWTLTLTNLQPNVAIDPATFRIASQEAPGTRVQVMGQQPAKTLQVGDEAPDWTLKDGNGQERKLSDFRGKLVVLDFWASWCPHCREAMPSMQKLHERYAARGVEIVGVNCREKAPINAGAYVREKGYTYTVLTDSGEVAPKYRVKGIPAFFVVGPDGKILHADSGFNAAKETALIGVIEQHLAGS